MSDLCLIFAGGPEEDLPCLPVPQEDAWILCADSGLRLAQRMGVTPDLVLGDFDSLGALPDAPYYQAPVEKDDTDTVLAVRFGLEKGCRRFVIYGALGGRFDHSFANIQTLLLLHQHGARGILVGASDMLMLQTAGTTVEYPKREGFTFSVFSLTTQCEGVSIRGVRYPLENATLTMYHPLGVSNEITDECAVLRVEQGIVLIAQSKL